MNLLPAQKFQRKLKSASALSALEPDSTDIFASSEKIDKRLSDYMSITSPPEHMEGISFYEFVVWFTETTNKFDKVLSSDLLTIENDNAKTRYFKRRDFNSVYNTSPKMPPDFNDTMGAWGILLGHHKHYKREEYNSWSFENSVAILRKEIELGNMEESMTRVVAKLKSQEEFLSDTQDPSQERTYQTGNDDDDLFPENVGKSKIHEGFEMEDLNGSIIDPLLLNQPIFPGATIADRMIFNQAENFIKTIKLQHQAENSLKLMEFVKDGFGSDSINHRACASTHLLEFYNSYMELGNDQRDSFNIVAAHLTEQLCVKTPLNPTGQLRMIISGEGGTGKSKLIDILRLYGRMYYGYDHTFHGPVLVVAPTGMAANNVNGATVDSACYTWKYTANNENDVKFMKLIQDNLGLLQLIIIDELSMLGLRNIGKLDKILRKATGKYDQFFGGVHFILVGDLYQLPPVLMKPVYTDEISSLDDMNMAGFELYRSCTCYKELLRNFRQEDKSESEFVDCLRRVRFGTATQSDADFFQKRVFDISEIASLDPTTLFVASKHTTCAAGNHKHLHDLEKNGSTIIYCWAIHTRPRQSNHSSD